MPHRTMPPAIVTILACAGLALTLSAQPASKQDQPRKDADARTTTHRTPVESSAVVDRSTSRHDR